MTKYLLNTPVLTAHGMWRMDGPLDRDEARQELAGGFVSAVGHEATARWLGELLDLKVEVARSAIVMATGDRAVVFRLLDRLPEGLVIEDVEQLARLSWELALLTREE